MKQPKLEIVTEYCHHLNMRDYDRAKKVSSKLPVTTARYHATYIIDHLVFTNQLPEAMRLVDTIGLNLGLYLEERLR